MKNNIFKILLIILLILGIGTFAIYTLSLNSNDTSDIPKIENNKVGRYAYSEIGRVEDSYETSGNVVYTEENEKTISCKSCTEDKMDIKLATLIEVGDIVYKDIENGIEVISNERGFYKGYEKSEEELLIKLVNIEKLEALTYIPQEDIDSIDIGMDVLINYNQKTYNGKIDYIAFEIISNSVEVKITFETDSEILIRDGSNTGIKIVRKFKENVLMIYKECIYEVNGNYYVNELINDSEIKVRKIEIGFIGIENVEVLYGIESGKFFEIIEE